MYLIHAGHLTPLSVLLGHLVICIHRGLGKCQVLYTAGKNVAKMHSWSHIYFIILEKKLIMRAGRVHLFGVGKVETNKHILLYCHFY